jgi:hypothetical protein
MVRWRPPPTPKHLPLTNGKRNNKEKIMKKKMNFIFWYVRCCSLYLSENAALHIVSRLFFLMSLLGCYQGRNQKRSVGGARVKKIKCLGQKKHHFLLHELYFSANQGSARASVGTYLGAATGCYNRLLISQKKKKKNLS